MSPAIARNANRAFTLMEAFVIIALVAVLVFVLLPPPIRDREKAHVIMCKSNLRQVGLGFMMWATDHADQLPWQVPTNAGGTMELTPSGLAADHFLTLSNYLKQPQVYWCPTDKTRLVAENYPGFSNTNLSYFAALVTITNGASIVLSGERHLQLNGTPLKRGLLSLTNNISAGWTRELHSQMSVATGNLLFADGHTEYVKTENLPAVLLRQAITTNRLVIP